MKKIFYVIISLLVICVLNTKLSGQVSITNTGTLPDNSSMLDVNSTSKGMLIPRMTTLQRDGIQSPAVGLFIYNTDINCFQYWNGNTWLDNCGSQSATSPCTAQAGIASVSSSNVTCGGNVTLTLNGYTGIVQWQQSTDGAFYSNVAGAVSASVTLPVNNPTTYYIAQVKNGTCATGYSNAVKVTASGCSAINCTTFGGTADDYGQGIVQTADGGYAVAGYTDSYGAGGWDFYVVKFDATGNISWTKTIGGTGTDEAFAIIQSSDGGYVVSGLTNSFGAGATDMYVVKLDANGNILWTQTIGGANDDYGNGIAQTTDGGFVVGGYTWSFTSGGRDMYAAKLDANGNLLWTRTVGGFGDDLAFSITATNDGGCAISGMTTAYGAGNWDMYAARLNADGSVAWTTTVGGSNTEFEYGTIQNTDGSFMLVGWTYSFGTGGAYNLYVAKLTSGGSVVWTNVIELTSSGPNQNCITQTTDGGWLVCGTAAGGNVANSIFAVKLDASGNVSWAKNVGSGSVSSVIKTSDGGYAIIASTSSEGAGGSDMLILKLDMHGNSCCSSDLSNPSTTTGGSQGTGGTYTTGGSAASGNGVGVNAGGTKISQCN